MQSPDSNARSNEPSDARLTAAFLYILATSVLMLMLTALEPMLALPLAAFLAMAALTRLLGLRLYGDLALATGRNKRVNPLSTDYT